MHLLGPQRSQTQELCCYAKYLKSVYRCVRRTFHYHAIPNTCQLVNSSNHSPADIRDWKNFFDSLFLRFSRYLLLFFFFPSMRRLLLPWPPTHDKSSSYICGESKSFIMGFDEWSLGSAIATVGNKLQMFSSLKHILVNTNCPANFWLD